MDDAPERSVWKPLFAEFIGTAALVLLGCGAAVLAGDSVGQLGIAFAFGLAVVAMAYGVGQVSGCHINPAISFGAYVAGRMQRAEMFRYWGAQSGGAFAGACLLLLIASGRSSYAIGLDGLGQNGWGEGYLGEYGVVAAFTWEVVATFLFVVVVLGATQAGAPTAAAGLAIGLTLAVIHIVGIRITGVSVNPARSLGPALVVQGQALAQLWLFIVAPLIGAGAAGWLFRTRRLSP
ncbi:MAG: aquaporin [Hyphomonadaceae bacterium]|nr:aquaporin [Hyphomonadaceae bacterium]